MKNTHTFQSLATVFVQFLFIVICFNSTLYGQGLPPFVVNGNASQLSAECYQLTPEASTQAGSIWSETQIDLTESFEAEARLYLGCANPISCFEDADDGADGIVFAFQPISTSVGSSGGGMGISGVTPSLFIEFDTYPNGGSGDPAYDHISMGKNGDVSHLSANSLTTFVPMIDATTNAEDCNEHILNVSWDATTQTMSVYFDCNLKLTYTADIVSEIFNGDPNVFWGFTSATGACTNEQRVCINIPPTFQTNDTTICAGESVQLYAPDNGFSYLWTPDVGLTNASIFNPVATPDVTTTYHVAVSNSCDLIREFEVTITVNQVPYSVLDTAICAGEMLIVGNNIYIEPGTYIGTFDMPNGCDSIVETHLALLPNASYSISAAICVGTTYILPDLTEVSASGIYTITIPSATGCDSTITVDLTVNNPDCNDNDCTTDDVLNTATCTCEHSPISPPDCNDNDCNTSDSYNTTTCTCEHSPISPPDCNDNDPTTADSYNSTTCTCEHTPITFNSLVIPSAFSPDGDNLNDELRPLSSTTITGTFRIYNRWGQLVFETSDVTVGWNGKYNGRPQEIGVYVYWLEYATTNAPTELKTVRGNVTLIR